MSLRQMPLLLLAAIALASNAVGAAKPNFIIIFTEIRATET